MLADAMSYAPYLYTPFIGIYGEKTMVDTGLLTVSFFDKALEPKELVEIPGTSHVSLDDIAKDVGRAVAAMDVYSGNKAGLTLDQARGTAHDARSFSPAWAV